MVHALRGFGWTGTNWAEIGQSKMKHVRIWLIAALWEDVINSCCEWLNFIKNKEVCIGKGPNVLMLKLKERRRMRQFADGIIDFLSRLNSYRLGKAVNLKNTLLDLVLSNTMSHVASQSRTQHRKRLMFLPPKEEEEQVSCPGSVGTKLEVKMITGRRLKRKSNFSLKQRMLRKLMNK